MEEPHQTVQRRNSDCKQRFSFSIMKRSSNLLLQPALHTNTGKDMPALWPHLVSSPAVLCRHRLPDDPHCLFLPIHTWSHPDPKPSTPSRDCPPSSLPSAPHTRVLPSWGAAASKEFSSQPPAKSIPHQAPQERHPLGPSPVIPSLVCARQETHHAGSEGPGENTTGGKTPAQCTGLAACTHTKYTKI